MLQQKVDITFTDRGYLYLVLVFNFAYFIFKEMKSSRVLIKIILLGQK